MFDRLLIEDFKPENYLESTPIAKLHNITLPFDRIWVCNELFDTHLANGDSATKTAELLNLVAQVCPIDKTIMCGTDKFCVWLNAFACNGITNLIITEAK